MRHNQKISVIIPMLNEERSIGKVLAEIPSWVDEVICVDNGSSDRSVEKATHAGAKVLNEPNRGYGSACQTGIRALTATEVVVFLDGDYSDYPQEMDRLVDPILKGEAQLVIGSRVQGHREKGALTPQARFGNWLACRLIRLFWGVKYTDLGPFRAIRYSVLEQMKMSDLDYGWTVEMQLKAARMNMPSLEVPVSYRRRIGRSKVSGTFRGVVGAGTKILGVIFRSALHLSD